MLAVSVPKLTIDTNCVINLFDQESTSATSVDDLRALIRYALESKVAIAVTTRLEADLLRDRDPERRQEFLDKLQMFPIISTIGRWGVTRWDTDVWVDEPNARLNREIQQILSPGLTTSDLRYSNKINDIDHLTGHKINGRDLFVTDDRGILRRRDQLKNGPGIMVMTPAEALHHVDDIVLRSTPHMFPTNHLSPDYHDPRVRGEASFDYTNNDGQFAVGDAQHLFETRWSKASNTSIHAYRESSSIEAIALAKGINEIVSIRDAEVFDFSSRTRMPRLGEIIIWRNMNGLYGATRIIGITDDSRGDDSNILKFEFVLLPDGRRDFAQ